MRKRLAALLPAAALLAGCSAAGDVETLLRAPQLSGESAALQKALNSYLGGSATLKYPASGDFLSPFAFGDWDGDGVDEAAVLYTADTTSSNVWLAVLEPSGESGWRVSQAVEGMSSEVESFSAASLKDADSKQLLTGYISPQGDQYLAVYQYDNGSLSTVISKSYTDMIVANFTGKGDTQDLVLALPPDTELGGVTLQLLTANDGEFRSTQTLNLGEGAYSSCAALYAGVGSDDGMYLVMDAWTGISSLVSDIILYDPGTGFLQPYRPSGMSDIQRSTLRYHADLRSFDIDGNGTVDIPAEIDDGGDLQTPVDKRLVFLLWKDYANNSGGNSLLHAALDVHGIGTSGDILHALIDEGLCQHGGGGGAVTGSIVGLGGDLANELCAHVLKLVLQLNLLGDGDTVIGDERAAELLAQHDIAALGAEGNLNGVGQLVNTCAKRLAGVLALLDLFSHNRSLLLSERITEKSNYSTTARMSLWRTMVHSSPSTLTSVPEYLLVRTLSPTLTIISTSLPSTLPPGPTATTSATCGFSLAEPDRIRPPLVVSSSSTILMTTRSARGLIFIVKVPPYKRFLF